MATGWKACATGDVTSSRCSASRRSVGRSASHIRVHLRSSGFHSGVTHRLESLCHQHAGRDAPPTT